MGHTPTRARALASAVTIAAALAIAVALTLTAGAMASNQKPTPPPQCFGPGGTGNDPQSGLSQTSCIGGNPSIASFSVSPRAVITGQKLRGTVHPNGQGQHWTWKDFIASVGGGRGRCRPDSVSCTVTVSERLAGRFPTQYEYGMDINFPQFGGTNTTIYADYFIVLTPLIADVNQACDTFASAPPPTPSQLLDQNGYNLPFTAPQDGTLLASAGAGASGGLPDTADTAQAGQSYQCHVADGGGSGGLPDAADHPTATTPACTKLKKTVLLARITIHLNKGHHHIHIPLTTQGRNTLKRYKRQHLHPCSAIKLRYTLGR